MENNGLETEIKVRVHSARYATSLLTANGFAVRTPRHFEENLLFDSSSLQLRNAGQALRLRRTGEHSVLTFKGPQREGPHKSREEIEFGISDFDSAHTVLERLGFEPKFRYEKFRTEYHRLGDPGVVLLDETPIGDFVEIEGPGPWIDSTASKLGFKKSSYVLDSYIRLYFQWCQARGIPPTNMTFAT